MGQTLVKEKGIALTAAGNGQVSRAMPRVPISQIIIRIGTTPTFSGAGTWVATTSVNGIEIRYKAKQIIDWAGLYNKDDQISMGMQMLREWNKHMYGQAETANNFVITFPKPLPAAQLDLIFSEQSAENQGSDSGGDINAGTHDILYVTEPVKGKPIIPYISTGTWSHGTTSGHKFHFLPATLKEYRLHALMLATHDAGTLGDAELADIRIMNGKEQVFDGNMADLKSDFQRRRGVINTVATGMFIIAFPGGIKVEPDTLQLDMNISAAASSEGLVNYAMICYG
ncbi:hypothetical protein ES702_05205 [subsurface metagenome]